jgi:hypothetical protein
VRITATGVFASRVIALRHVLRFMLPFPYLETESAGQPRRMKTEFRADGQRLLASSQRA